MIIFENKTNEKIQYEPMINSTIQRIKSSGVSIVGLFSNRTPELLYLLQALFDNGIAFVTIDPLFPQEYIQYIIYNSGIKMILTQEKYVSQFTNIETIIINDKKKYLSKFCDEYPQNDIAYILYTSGSTGKPKGVEVTRDALLNFMEGVSEIIDFSVGKRIACLTTVSFDIFILESLVALHKGLTVVLANEDEQHNPKLMARIIEDNSIDMIQITPSRMQLLLNYDNNVAFLKNVKEIMIGGEPLPLGLLRTLQKNTTAKIYNMYGPTETTIWSTVGNLTNKEQVDIGQPIKNTEIYIVDENLYTLPDGHAGEICIAGKGLANGYVGRNDLTAEKFVNLPRKPETKVYRTGDIGRYLKDGRLEYLGRIDNQVKIRGHRIELEEIESHLNQVEGINQSVVIVLATSDTDKIMQAFYTSKNNISSETIYSYLSTKIPAYMIPSVFKRIEGFIQMTNGKIDRKRVLECAEMKFDDVSLRTPILDGLTDVQKRVFEIIISNIKKSSSNISLDMDFASVGLDSINFIKTIVALEDNFDFEFEDEMLTIEKFPKIKSMIEYVESRVQP